ncbi:MAG: phage virion morphogenesis protein [Bacteroidales bacterium]
MVKNQIPNFKKIGELLISNASRYAATESVKFFRDGFTKDGFTDSSFQKWQANSSKRTLHNKGTLMRSIRKQKQNRRRVVVGSEQEYAQIHNQGGYIVVTEQMKKLFWAKFIRIASKGKTDDDGKAIKGYGKTKNKKALYFKYMAMKKVGSKIKIPQRKFIGESKTLMNNFDHWFGETVRKQIEPNFNDSQISFKEE